MIATIPDILSCQYAGTVYKLASQTALQRHGTRTKVLPVAADEVADERIAADVTAPSARRDGIAAWK